MSIWFINNSSIITCKVFLQAFAGTVLHDTSGTYLSATTGTILHDTSGTYLSVTTGTILHDTSGTYLSATTGTILHDTSGTYLSATTGTISALLAHYQPSNHPLEGSLIDLFHTPLSEASTCPESGTSNPIETCPKSDTSTENGTTKEPNLYHFWYKPIE